MALDTASHFTASELGGHGPANYNRETERPCCFVWAKGEEEQHLGILLVYPGDAGYFLFYFIFFLPGAWWHLSLSTSQLGVGQG